MSVFSRAIGPIPAADQPAWWFIFRGRSLLMIGPATSGAESARSQREVLCAVAADVPFDQPAPEQLVLIGYRDDVPCVAGIIAADAPLPEGVGDFDLRRLYGHVDEDFYGYASYAYQVAYWHQTSRYCPVCGSRTEPNSSDWGRTCPSCGHIGYPRVSPCAIVLVHDGADRVLLVRQPAWAAGMYSLVAGFVEPAESLEQCLIREVREEIGVSVDQLTYMGSQPWSFPHQLMVGYTARYAGGEIRIDPTEIEDACWFELDDLPSLPPPLSIARQIIDRHRAARYAHRSSSK